MSLDPTTWGWPFPATVAAFFVVVVLRANATYWLGRLVRRGAERSRAAALLARPGYRRAEGWVDRWGAPAVTVSFLTVGVQTLVNLAAGVGRMSLWRYLPAVVVGSVLWALVYSTVGFVGLAAVRLLWDRSPWLVVAAALLLALLLLAHLVRARRRAPEPAGTAR
ncbi:hypothetical protein GC722_02255 [Auraticoccus sp. F435]|uniref:VTT domain-containing protein n=1 Tax=Auraticoccus cholistanensis TaxID=2656650 RepID=A0A6A9V026_9ACTN|nr:VTT domain-containing protein [Auraticoccus cholistanensis]MVA74859.1 hypothetical protein [Auraticoccus cholistanensis]